MDIQTYDTNTKVSRMSKFSGCVIVYHSHIIRILHSALSLTKITLYMWLVALPKYLDEWFPSYSIYSDI